MTILVTGGAGFIGSNFVLQWIEKEDSPVVNLDKLTYAGNLQNLEAIKDNPRHIFVQGDIQDRALVSSLLTEHRPWAILHFAAESHVDRSILGPQAFIETNVLGTFQLLEAARFYWDSLAQDERATFRFLHVSTDEVYGSLDLQEPAFSETTTYRPNSPYSASKAGSDHLVRAYQHTYGLPTLTTNCSNNYGPFQFPEKLIPLVVLRALSEEAIPVYGSGENVRDWLHVLDHCDGIRSVLSQGQVGEAYNIGGCNERQNIEVVRTICSVLDTIKPRASGEKYESLIQYVTDRPGHDFRYAIDASKMQTALQWQPKMTFESGIEQG